VPVKLGALSGASSRDPFRRCCRGPPAPRAGAADVRLCERVFASKNEAFTAGLYVGERDEWDPENTDA
jgi:hypothetical protein